MLVPFRTLINRFNEARFLINMNMGRDDQKQEHADSMMSERYLGSE
jgi:hypothetical protein